MLGGQLSSPRLVQYIIIILDTEMSKQAVELLDEEIWSPAVLPRLPPVPTTVSSFDMLEALGF
jgi:hypothetical protein